MYIGLIVEQKHANEGEKFLVITENEVKDDMEAFSLFASQYVGFNFLNRYIESNHQEDLIIHAREQLGIDNILYLSTSSAIKNESDSYQPSLFDF